jgi:hypothetical protein
MKSPDSFEFPRVQALPDGASRVSLRVDGVERVGYEFGSGHARPFFYPVIGVSGRPLTRMGHPNPVGHEHHKSVWFGHQKVGGINFWEERAGTDVRIRHRRITAFRDGSYWAGFAADLDWWAQGRAWMRHHLIAALEPRDDGGFALDLQSRFEAAGGAVELGQTNFGFLGVRVAKTMSEQFGGGRLTNDRGATGEPSLFGQRARWVDYSGPSAPWHFEGIAYFDHPSNPGHPTHWHVRRDGWMEAAWSLPSSFLLAPDHPLDLRYRLLIHAGPADRPRLDREWDAFAGVPPYESVTATGPDLPTIRRRPPAG